MRTLREFVISDYSRRTDLVLRTLLGKFTVSDIALELTIWLDEAATYRHSWFRKMRLALLFSCITTFITSTAFAQRIDVPMLQEVSDALDVARFDIPEYWTIDTEADGSAMFYDATPGAGTLRVTAMMFRNDGRRDIKSKLDDWYPTDLKRSYYISAVGDSIRETSDSGMDAGVHFVTQQLYLLHQRSTREICLLLFHWTCGLEFASMPENENSLILVRQALVNARFNEARLGEFYTSGADRSERKRRNARRQR